MKNKRGSLDSENGFSLTELMVVLVIVGVLVLLALPRLLPVVTKAKNTEAKLMLKQIHTLQQTFKFEYDRYASSLPDIGFEQTKLINDGGQARYKQHPLMLPLLPATLGGLQVGCIQ